MAKIADLLTPKAHNTLRQISVEQRAIAFRQSVYASIAPTASPKSQAWGKKQLKRMKYLRQMGRLETAPVITKHAKR